MIIDIQGDIDDILIAITELKKKLGINNQLLVKTKIYLTFKINKSSLCFHTFDYEQAQYLVFRNGSLYALNSEVVPRPKIPEYVSSVPKTYTMIDVLVLPLTQAQERKKERRAYDERMQKAIEEHRLKMEEERKVKRLKYQEKKRLKQQDV